MKIESIDTLPPRIPLKVVCRLAGYSKSTLIRRISEGKMPQPIDRAKQMLFLTTDVLNHLGLSANVDCGNPWEKGLEAFQRRHKGT